jgi:ketosteroid isomerase-like protein
MNRHFFLAFLLVANFAHAQQNDEAIHDELRGILSTMQEAINSGDFDAMLPIVSEDIRATTIRQEPITGRDAIVPYFEGWFGEGGELESLEMQMTPDTLTELSEDRRWGLVRGSGSEHYTLTDGRVYDLTTRWTAVVAREDDGVWRLRSIHIGTDFLDNPILDEAVTAATNYAIGGIAGGLLVGGLLGFLIGKRKQA